MSTKSYSKHDLELMGPQELRSMIRRGEWTEDDTQFCRGYVKANLAIIPKEYAFDFLLFCYRNPRPCALVDVTEPGDPEPKLVAPSADIRTDLPRYRVWKNGECIDEPTDVIKYWRDDLVGFLIGCAASFWSSLEAANIRSREVGAYTSNISCVPAGCFHGPMVVSCFLVKGSHGAVRAVQITSRYLLTHGPPIHIGDPAAIGIKDLMKPDIWSGNTAPREPDEIALFFGCGVTPQTVAMASKTPFMITHYPAHMFVADRLTEELAIL